MTATNRRVTGLSDYEVARLLGISKRTLLRWLRSELIPAPVGKLAANRRAWTIAELQAIKDAIERGISDQASHLEPTRRRRQNHDRRYARAVLRREGPQSTAA